MITETQKIYKVGFTKKDMKREKKGAIGCICSIPLNLNRCNA